MGRLIDADELLEKIRLNYNNHQNVSAGAIKDMINTTNTAYDVERVVAELEVQKNKRIQSILLNSQSDFIDQEITSEEKRFEVVKEIVRKGGVENG